MPTPTFRNANHEVSGALVHLEVDLGVVPFPFTNLVTNRRTGCRMICMCGRKNCLPETRLWSSHELVT